MSPGETVSAFFEAFSTLNMDNARPYLADDVVFENMGLNGPGRFSRGSDAICQRFQFKFDRCTATHWDITSQIEQGPLVFHERIDHFWFPDGTFAATNIQDANVCACFEVGDGKIRRWRDYADIAQTLRPLGVTLEEYVKALGLAYIPR